MKITYSSEKESDIFQTIKDRFHEPARGMLERELAGVQIPEESGFIKQLTEIVAEEWSKVEDNFLAKLGEFYGRNLEKPDDITIYLVRFFIGPYDFSSANKWFALAMFAYPAVRIVDIMHELCHYYQPLELERPIKEAIPVILNDHGAFKTCASDGGHNDSEEQKWRKAIWDVYSEGKTFWDIPGITGCETPDKT